MDIKDIIIKQKDLFEELLKLLDDQYEFLIGNDPMKVDKVARDLDDVSKEIAKIEIQRRKVMGTETKVSEVVDRLNDEETNESYEKIQTLLTSIQKQKEANDELLKNKMFFAKKMLNMLNPQGQQKTYNAYGQMKR